jgi:hypothetical protein
MPELKVTSSVRRTSLDGTFNSVENHAIGAQSRRLAQYLDMAIHGLMIMFTHTINLRVAVLSHDNKCNASSMNRATNLLPEDYLWLLDL